MNAALVTWLNSTKSEATNGKKLKEFNLSKRKLELLIRHGLVRENADSSTIVGSTDKIGGFLNIGIEAGRPGEISLNGSWYMFRKLYMLLLSPPRICGNKRFGCDIEYYVGGSSYAKLSHALKNKPEFANSGEDHGGEVLESRPDPDDSITSLSFKVTSYYTTLEKLLKKYNDEELCLTAFGRKEPPKLSFNLYHTGLHMHLHFLSNDEKIRIVPLLDLTACYFNTFNAKLWTQRLGNGYGKLSFSDATCVRDVNWRCSNPRHICIEYRAFNSGDPEFTNKVFTVVDLLFKKEVKLAAKDIATMKDLFINKEYKKLQDFSKDLLVELIGVTKEVLSICVK